MFTLRAKQLEILSSTLFEDFFDRAMRFLRANCGAHLSRVTERELTELIRKRHMTALSFGVHTERGVMMWIVLTILAGERFHELPAVAAALATRDRADWIIQQLFDRLSLLEMINDKPDPAQ